MSSKTRLVILAGIALFLIVIFMFAQVQGNWDYVLTRRAVKLGAIVLTGSAIAGSTVVFQTITNNRILTPSIVGFDSLYLLVQTMIVFIVGSATPWFDDARINFLLSMGLMILFSIGLYQTLFSRPGRGIHFVLLLGVILGTLFQSLASVMQVLIDPNEFLIVQSRMFASFNNINTNLLGISVLATLVIGIFFQRFAKYLDVLALGRDHAISLGVNYRLIVNRLLIVVAVLISVATALVGPITFLGLLVANLAYHLINTYQHKYLMAGAALLGVIALVGGQLIVERVLSFSTTISVIINFVGGLYFIGLLLKESRL